MSVVSKSAKSDQSSPDYELAQTWQEVKSKIPLGSVVVGQVLSSAPFGLFVDIGFGRRTDGKLMGIIEVVGSKSLPRDRESWPAVGALVRCKAFFYRDHTKEVDLELLGVECE